MWSSKLPKVRPSSLSGALSRRLVPPAASPTRPLSTSASLDMPKKKAAAEASSSSSSQNRQPHPTESEEDVTADRSPVDPLHAPKTANGQSKPAGAAKVKSSPSGHKQKITSK